MSVKEFVRQFSAFTPSERVEAIDGIGVVLGVSPDRVEVRARAAADTTPDIEPIVLSQALAAARRAGVEVDQNGRVSVFHLDASLAKSAMTPLQKIETKSLLAAAHMIP
jgi:hypothetical protein